MTSDEFAEELLKKEKVAVVPGTAFGDSGEGFPEFPMPILLKLKRNHQTVWHVLSAG